MRNAIFNGAGTRWISSMSKNHYFLKATGGSLDPKKMRDREAINRFAGFYIFGWKSCTNGDMDEFLARSLMHLNSKAENTRIGETFIASMRRNHKLFRDHAFRKSLAEFGDKKTVINMALFDALSWAFAQIPSEVSDTDEKQIKTLIEDFMVRHDFEDAITYSTNSTKQVRTRFSMTEDCLGIYMTEHSCQDI